MPVFDSKAPNPNHYAIVHDRLFFGNLELGNLETKSGQKLETWKVTKMKIG